MKDHVPHWRDDQRARERAAQLRRLRDERTNGRKPSWRRRILAGVILGSMGYLLTSCFVEHRLHKPKIERDRFGFDHRP